MTIHVADFKFILLSGVWMNSVSGITDIVDFSICTMVDHLTVLPSVVDRVLH